MGKRIARVHRIGDVPVPYVLRLISSTMELLLIRSNSLCFLQIWKENQGRLQIRAGLIAGLGK